MSLVNNPLDDYTMLSVIGKGSYAKVVLVRRKDNNTLYALKSMKKKYITLKNQANRIMMEKQILAQIDFEFLIKIHSSFQNEHKLFFVLEYCPGGQLFGLLLKKKKLTEEQAKFYAAQIVLALVYLHSKDIIYRDLKPQNVLISADGYIKLTDFGLSRNKISGEHDAFSICGTPEYLAPEVIKKEGHGKAVDWWCLGSLIYQLVHGLPPFFTKNRNELFDKIKNSQPYFNKQWSNTLRDLLSKLLDKNPEKRIKNISQIQSHPWFEKINWEMLFRRQMKVPFIPVINHDSDVSNFDRQFTECDIESQCTSLSSCAAFEGFSFEKGISPSSQHIEEKHSREIDETHIREIDSSEEMDGEEFEVMEIEP